jgi:hypothetical protein
MVTRACLANAQAIKEFGPGPITNSERLQLAGAHVGVGSGVDEHNTSRGSVFVQRVGDPQGRSSGRSRARQCRRYSHRPFQCGRIPREMIDSTVTLTVSSACHGG